MTSATPDTALPEYAAEWLDHNLPPRVPAGEVVAGWLTLLNRGCKTWQPGAFQIAVDLDGARVFHVALPHAVGTSERLTLCWVFRVTRELGQHEFCLDLVEEGVTTFEHQGVPPLRVAFEVFEQPVSVNSSLRDEVLATHARCWLPCDGVSWSRGGPGYPQFARHARGCRLVDVDGREYVDFLMGWGTALLGYAHPRVQAAVAAALSSGATTTVTPQLMPEVAARLRAVFPGAEAATFGKNGSDVCTAAVRMARVYTGRPIVLYCGYHGWQDWYAQRYGFAATGIPAAPEPLLVPFPPNDLAEVARLFDSHHGRVAAVMLEPAGVIESSSGPIRDADPTFLRALAELVRREGALLVFDEILTGFRHLGGSVQAAAGVVPDLTCLGKALSGGMPLAALVGRKELFDAAIGRICFEPTFKGESYSFAAARESLAIYAEQDVPARIAAFGNRLRATIGELCRAAGVAAEAVGPPFRMMVVFAEPDARRRHLQRTLLQQELMKHGVLTTQNLLLPSIAHDDEALAVVARAFERAFAVVAEAERRDRYASHLEIPPLPG
ncbi:MAG TPA: aminotransferase class III-fold pyridoxal phosphate-dependent enzyme [Thermoanaerobaculia bacterium]|jgi:glutamate-1-semialdehyde aminotransferase|nr:aminotransferase class III-fold pyridoxal phosphate-dependent enzyme [Thermoanaerobaculia bacterium]